MSGIKITEQTDEIRVSKREIKRVCNNSFESFHPSYPAPFHCRQSLIPRIVIIPRNHDYLNCLYNAIPENYIIERPVGEKLEPDKVDILHVHWPEHLAGFEKFIQGNNETEHRKFIEAVGRSPIRVVWTMHNRLPHGYNTDWSKRLYRAWASVADGVIHHSRWGMELIQRELPFKPDAKHVVIPVGHYKEQMSAVKSRAALEKELNLKPCPMRFGVIGRPQKEKQVDLIMRAFHAAARDDQQLLVTAITEDMDIPDDPRIIPVYRKGWLKREELCRQVKLCDALVCAHTGSTYLTSGLVADAVGAGIPMLVSEWGFFREIMGEAALYFDGTEKGLARLFTRITTDDIEAGKRASAALQQDYSWTVVAEKTLNLFRELWLQKFMNIS